MNKNRMKSQKEIMNLMTDYSMLSADEIHLRGEDFRGKIGDVRGDGAACQELCNFVGEGVAVVLKQAIPVSSEDTAEENIS